MDLTINATDAKGKLHTIKGYENSSVMENLREAGLVEGVCGGVCSCATCHVAVHNDWVAKTGTRNEEEEMLLEELPEMQETSRLSCQIEFTAALDGLEVTILEE
ncbi:MAG: 2Fe-2S iron-sulfur cluster binding domain-containing protein [Alphaproteobacteria bacterium]|nr:2Fe-2S iron-sulfur cluster binding domain-containing protein [Alphaproteobacteria bacterium]